MYIYVVVAYILYDGGGAVIVVSRPRGVAHGDDECFWASRGDRKTPRSRDDIIIIKRYIIIIINYYCHVRVSWQALRSTRGDHKIQNLRDIVLISTTRVSIFLALSIIITMCYILYILLYCKEV